MATVGINCKELTACRDNQNLVLADMSDQLAIDKVRDRNPERQVRTF